MQQQDFVGLRADVVVLGSASEASHNKESDLFQFYFQMSFLFPVTDRIL